MRLPHQPRPLPRRDDDGTGIVWEAGPFVLTRQHPPNPALTIRRYLFFEMKSRCRSSEQRAK
jgi:hypothetical protein